MVLSPCFVNFVLFFCFLDFQKWCYFTSFCFTNLTAANVHSYWLGVHSSKEELSYALRQERQAFELNEIYSADQVICSLLHVPDPTTVNKSVMYKKDNVIMIAFYNYSRVVCYVCGRVE